MLSQAAVRATSLDGVDLSAAVREALDATDGDRAAVLVLAAARGGARFPAELIGRIIGLLDTRIALVPLVASAEGDRPAMLLQLVGSGLLQDTWAARALLLAAILADESKASDGRKRVGALVRTVARKVRHPASLLDLGLAARLLGDEHAASVVGPAARMADGRGDEVAARLRAELEGAWLGLLPETAPRAVATGYTVRRDAAKVGRNDPCACGSGKKFKKCCDGKIEPVIAAQSYAEIGDVPLRELVKLDAAALPAPAAIALLRALSDRQLWEDAERVLQKLALRRDIDDVEGHRGDTAMDALEAGAHEAATRLAAGLTDLPASAHFELALLAEPQRGLALLEAAAEQVLRRPLAEEEAIDLAYSLLRCSPALGIFVARGALSTKRSADAETLLEVIEEARDQLGLPPEDAAIERYELLLDAQAERDTEDAEAASAASRDQHMQVELEAARREMHDAQAKARRLDEALRLQEAALRRAEPTTTAPVETEEARRLRAKVQELKGLVSEAHAERRTLRTELARARDEVAKPLPDLEEPEEAEPEEPAGADASAPRGLHVPSFSAMAKADLHALPARVAQAAMVTIAEIGAGDLAAWRGVKQMADFKVPTLTARIGIRHRVIFRLEEATLMIERVLPREELMGVLKKMR